jgi:chlorite dismutase
MYLKYIFFYIYFYVIFTIINLKNKGTSVLKNYIFLSLCLITIETNKANGIVSTQDHTEKALKSAVLEKDYQQLTHIIDSTLNSITIAITTVEQSTDRQKLLDVLGNLNEILNIESKFFGINLGTPGLSEAKNSLTEFVNTIKDILTQSIQTILGIQTAKGKFNTKPNLSRHHLKLQLKKNNFLKILPMKKSKSYFIFHKHLKKLLLKEITLL